MELVGSLPMTVSRAFLCSPCRQLVQTSANITRLFAGINLNGHFQLNPIPLPILIMNKIICFVGSFSKLYSQSLFSAYTSCIYCHYLRFRGPGCPDGRYNRKKFQFRSCIFYGRSVIDGFRQGDPNRIPDPYSRSTEEGREV